MGILIVVAAAIVAAYGAATGSGWALGLGAASMVAGMLRLSGSKGEADIESARRHASAFVVSPWKLTALATAAAAGLATQQVGQTAPSRSALVLWLASLVLAITTGVLHDKGQPLVRRLAQSIAWNRRDWVIVAACTAVALGLRLYRLDAVLPPMHGDEGEMGMLARLALHGPGGSRGDSPLLYFRTGFLDHPTMFHHMQAVAMRVFGDSVVGLRLFSVATGTAMVPFIYLIARLGWGHVAAGTASWLLAVSELEIQYSRAALSNIQSSLSIVVVIALLAVAGEQRLHPPEDGPERRLTLFVLIGLVSGVSFYFNLGSRVLALIVPIVLLQLMLAKRAQFRDVVVVATTAVVASLPLLWFYLADFSVFVNRTRGVSVLSAEGTQRTLGPDASLPGDLPALAWHQLRENIGFFVNLADASSFYTGEQVGFDPVTLLLLWLGLGVVLAQSFGRSSLHESTACRSRTTALAVITWLLVTLVTGGMLTSDSPNSSRLLMVIPAVFILGGAAVRFGWRTFGRLGITHARRVGAVIAAVLAIATVSVNVDHYFVDYADSAPTTVIDLAQEMSAVPDDTRVLLLGSPNLFANHGTIRFVADGTDKRDLFEDADFEEALAEAAADDKDLLLVVLSHRVDDLETIRATHSGVLTEHFNQYGSVDYTTYFIPTPG